ncbi:hypothetical protein PhCBS80983_g04646 [Powellomyces hirtus]|uniref:DUF1772 domain-containing protein n=1 Tax=Powellomyces hirtus TaxID=109895 RepID=A0A507DY08_9FUNG|nr:hypothetical protein PhCBS80983_g04646 [Powellomyces hirtus]
MLRLGLTFNQQTTVLETTAILATGLFAGGALYISTVEHPARFRMSAESAQRQFQHSYPRAARLQGTLAVVAGGCSLILGVLTRGTKYYVSAAAMLFIPIYTVIAVFPTNNRLLATSSHQLHGTLPQSEAVWPLLRKWGYLHSARLVASFLGLGVLLSAAS